MVLPSISHRPSISLTPSLIFSSLQMNILQQVSLQDSVQILSPPWPPTPSNIRLLHFATPTILYRGHGARIFPLLAYLSTPCSWRNTSLLKFFCEHSTKGCKVASVLEATSMGRSAESRSTTLQRPQCIGQ